MRPLLPSARCLLPYLAEIDKSRIYSNYGPLSLQLEHRLESHFGVPDGCVRAVANGTLGLTLTLLAQNVPPGAFCVMPAWTFIATAHAAALAGLVPFFVDVDPATWALDPEAVRRLLVDLPGPVGALMPVVPFGQPIDVPAWNEFHLRTRIAVVIDAAAGFDSAVASDVPAVISLHATKVLGAGEGGFVLCRDASLIHEVGVRANFGFSGTRESVAAAANGKLSEYHAAVANAALDEWPAAREAWLAASAAYREALREAAGVRLQPGFGEAWVSSVCVLDAGESGAETVESSLQAAGIGTRHWWSTGAHAQPSSAELPRLAVPVTDRLARSTIGVPLFRDMSRDDVRKVVDRVAAVCSDAR